MLSLVDVLLGGGVSVGTIGCSLGRAEHSLVQSLLQGMVREGVVEGVVRDGWWWKRRGKRVCCH